MQSIFDDNLVDSAVFESVVIPDKTQYRIFFLKMVQVKITQRCYLCYERKNFEFAELRGIKPSQLIPLLKKVMCWFYMVDLMVMLRQEKGDDFDGTKISGRYRSPDLTFGDPGIRKHMQRVILNYEPEAQLTQICL